MKAKIIINIEWHRVDKKLIPADHVDALMETAEEHIFDQLLSGWTAGWMEDNIHMLDSDPEEGVEYSGFWSMGRVIE